ncbi:Pyrroline-5-carboxylate reductase [uncultured archaeon]|nr:Pyrroline-5-carboxylate reductase [uncultured archaeon]
MTTVGFLGVGRMGSALISAFCDKKLVAKKDVLAYDPRPEAAKELNIQAAENEAELVRKSDVVFLCVKPQTMEAALSAIKKESGGKLFVSIAAGITTGYIEGRLDKAARVIRVMPNTPAMVGLLAAGYAKGKRATTEDTDYVKKLLTGIGVATEVPEDQLDAITGLSGSGPAYAYQFIEAIAKAGEKQGLSYSESLKLAAQTTKGAAEMILSTGKTPKELTDMVASPGGTTIEGLKVLTQSDFSKIVGDTVAAATKRSKELRR